MSFLFLKYCKKSSDPAYNTSLCLHHRHSETVPQNNPYCSRLSTLQPCEEEIRLVTGHWVYQTFLTSS